MTDVWLKLDDWYQVWNWNDVSGHARVEVPDELLERWEKAKEEFVEIQAEFERLARVRGKHAGRVA